MASLVCRCSGGFQERDDDPTRCGMCGRFREDPLPEPEPPRYDDSAQPRQRAPTCSPAPDNSTCPCCGFPLTYAGCRYICENEGGVSVLTCEDL